MTQVTYHAADLGFDRSWISDGALRVVRGLRAAGFDAYLVGGCVRDLVLQQKPKDFDITTNARPEQIKRLFARARLIGRRFRLVHVRFGREVMDVATYRAKPQRAAYDVRGQGRVVDDNVFGTIEQDISRRDFTINALYYDPTEERVLDFLGGVKDLRKNTLRMIGDARVRFAEDPVRILRALRFRAKLGLNLDGGLEPAIAACLELLEGVSAARLHDEMLKMFHHGHAVASWEELRAHNLIATLFPQTAEMIGHAESNSTASHLAVNDGTEAMILLALENTDQRIRRGLRVMPAFLFAVFLWQPFLHNLAQLRRRKPKANGVYEAGQGVCVAQGRHVGMSHRVSEQAIKIWEMQFQLEQRRPKQVRYLLEERRFRAAYDFLALRQRVGEVSEALVCWWTDIQEVTPERQQQMIDHLRAQSDPLESDPPQSDRSGNPPRRRRNHRALSR